VTTAAASAGPWTAFTAKAEVLGVAVVHAASEDAAARVLHESAERVAVTASVANGFPRAAEGLPRAADAPAREVAAAALFGVTETGSVAVNEPRPDRGACFLADRLWLLVPESELVEDLEEALRRIQQLVAEGAHHPLLMSGPSRTADIERVLTVGVHGPRALVVLIVGSP
jgi:L-lactate dehydrogenase complex protein LldG